MHTLPAVMRMALMMRRLCNSHQTTLIGSCCRLVGDDPVTRSSNSYADRTKAVTSYYFQAAIDQAAAKVS